ncbi:hypothetical protein AB0B01_12190 [Streptomyces sp. NPDC044571]|uniref:hypothetical protein n=1 Tax=Streptomyces sp. NPDC044571 TaxID=3155371 RepID=UPI0033F01EEC
MTHWQDRKAIGEGHEQTVADALRARGWTVQNCGQGTYAPAIQQALVRTTSALRWFPDLIAARAGQLVTIDAKDRMPSSTTNRYALSNAALTAGLQFTAAHAPTPLYYVFGDLKVLTPVEVLHYTDHAQPGTGSYRLIHTRRAHCFDDVFGRFTSQAA